MLVTFTNNLLAARITELRDRNTSRENFRRVLKQISVILAAEIGNTTPTTPVEVETPLEKASGERLSAPVVLVPILRAGLGMVAGFEEVFHEAPIGHIGIVRDEKTLQPTVYSRKLPPVTGQARVLVLDPMLATGSSAAVAIDIVKETRAKDIHLVSCLASPEGIQRIASTHPDVTIVIAAVDRALNNKGYILPGLGDAGDRQFGT